MKTQRLFATLCTAVLAALPALSVRAEDIDVFTSRGQVGGGRPNVLFVMDNSANWSQTAPSGGGSIFTQEKAALNTAFSSLPVNQDGTAKFNVGIMMFTESGGGNSNTDGSYVRAAVRPMDTSTKAKYAALFDALDQNGDKSNGGKAGKTMAEVYRYLSSGAPIAGNGKAKTDYTGNASGSAASNAIYALPGNALDGKDATAYTGPSTANCTGTYVIFLSNGAAQDNNSDTATSEAALRAAGGDATMITLSPSGSQGNTADEWARFMKTSMGAKVFTIEAMPVTNGQGPGWTSLLRSMADKSSGDYYDLSKDPSGNIGSALVNALNNIFNKIQAQNSAFASVSLPISANMQGTYLNQVFIGLFRPDMDALPRWNGNLKQYKLSWNSQGTIQLVDANGNNAVGTGSNLIDPNVRSFWTPASADTYWSFLSQSQRDERWYSGASASNFPDGNIVEKGAQGYVLRGGTVAARTVYTYAAGATALSNFADDNAAITQAALGAANPTERTRLINWARGEDNMLDEGTATVAGTTPKPMRPSVHGDVVHSRPVAIDYGSATNHNVVVFYGGNDGALRAVNGNQTGSGAGGELWSFIPPEFYGNLKRLRDNTTPISYVGYTPLAGTPTPLPKPYGMDGPVSAYRSSDNTRAWIFATMRRGGRQVYAFDVSTPSAPTLKWRRGCPNLGNDTGCDTGMSGIGQTWSAAKVLMAQGYGAGTQPLVMFGGGYDACEDVDAATPACATATTKGNHVYVLDAASGTALKTFDTERAVSGEVTLLTDATGKATMAYAADLGGNVYRIDIGSSAPSGWTMTRIAALGCDTLPTAPGTTPTCAPNRKFLFGPDVVTDSSGANVIMIGSGDREKPLRYYTNALSVSNRFYMLVDQPTTSSWLSAETGNCNGWGVLCTASLGNAGVTGIDLSAKKGWYLPMGAGEQVVTSSITVQGVTTFSTHIPTDPSSTQVCKSDLGAARVYNLNYANGQGRVQDIDGGGLAFAPTAYRVQDDNGTTHDIVIGAEQNRLQPREASSASAFRQSKGRVYWHIQK